MVGWLIGQARMNALQPHRIASIILLLALSAAQALAFPVLFSDQGTDAKSGGVQVNNGDLTVQIWDSATGGTMVYGETFTGAILNGSWNVILGQSGDLQLEYGLTYYKEYQINGQDLDFTTPSTGTTERLGFTSPLGAVNMSKLMQVPNKPNIDAANITGGTILDARINNTRWVNYSNAACIALTGSADLCDGSDATSAGGAQQPNIDAANITSGTILNARYNLTFFDGAYVNEGAVASKPNIDASNVTSGVMQNPRYNSSFVVNYSNAACIALTGSADLCDGVDATSAGGASQPNIDAANITSGAILNARYNTSYILNQTYAANTYSPLTHNHISVYLNYSDSCPSGQIYEWGFGCVSMPSGGAAQPNIAGQNITSGLIGWQFLPQTTLNTTTCGAGFYYLYGSGCTPAPSSGSSQPNIDALNITSGVILNARYNSTYLMNYTACGSNQYWVYNSGCTAIPSGSAAQPNVDAANITGGTIANARYNLSYLAQAVNITDLWGNASNQDVRITTLEGISVAVPYWASFNGNTTSNLSINEGNVHISGRLSMNTSQAVGDNSVALGSSNKAYNYAAVGGGVNNIASGDGTVISGGANNGAYGQYSTVSGGNSNTANVQFAVVSGGDSNSALDSYAVVSGGIHNFARSYGAVVSGGAINIASGEYSVVLGGRNVNATGNYSLAYGDRVQAGTNVGNATEYIFAFGYSFTNPTSRSFAVGFGDITLNVTDNLVKVVGDVNATGVVCDGAGNCLNMIGGPANANNITQLWGNLSSTIVNYTALRGNVSAAVTNISALQGNVTGLWSNASNQDTRIISLEGRALQPLLDAANVTSGVFVNVRYNSSFLLNKSGTLTDTKVCTYSSAKGTIDCNSDPSTYDDSRVVANITFLWGNLSVVVVNITALQVNVTNLWTNASNQDTRIIALEGAGPANSNNITQLWGNLSSTVTNVSALRGNVSEDINNLTALRGNISSTIINVTALQGNVTNLWSNASNQDTRIISLEGAGPANSVNITQLWGNLSSTVINLTGLRGNVSEVVSNITSLRVNVSVAVANISALQGNVTNLWSNASNQDTRIIALEGAGPANGNNITQLWGNVSSVVLNITGLRDNVSSSVVNISALQGNVTNLWSNASNQDARIILLETNIISKPYWVNQTNAITSNSSINGGNVNVTGNLTVTDRLNMQGSIASGIKSVALGSYANATGVYSFALGSNISASASNSFAFGEHYTNPSPDSFTVGFTDITLNVSDNLLKVTGDVNATGRVCDGAGNCLNNVGNASAVPYWANLFGSITSNASLSGGNVNVTGNLKVMGRIAGNGSNAAGANAIALGFQNNASGDSSTVSGGSMNNASDLGAVVSGGWYNTADGAYAVVAGGFSNDANGSSSVVSGGEMNTAKGYFSVVSGGWNNLAAGEYSLVLGGLSNNATGKSSVILGGDMNLASGNYSIAGGNRSNATFTNSVALGNGAVASGRDSYSFGQNSQATAGNSYAFGRDLNSTNAGAISFGNGFANPVINSFAVGFGDITANITDNLLWVRGDINATGRICDGSGNCLSTVVGGSSQPNIDAANITSGVIANARYNASYLFNKSGVLTDGQYCTFNLSIGTLNCNSGAGSSTVTDQNISDLWYNASIQEFHIRSLQASNSSLWGNASNQDARIITLESKSGGLKPNIDAANITTGVVANARYNATYLFNKDGALTHGKFCTYNSSLGSIDCSGDSATYDDSRVVSNITQLWGNLSSAVVNITRLQANATSLWANASNQDQRIMTLEGNPASTPLWITQNLRTTSNSTINSGNVNVTGSLQAPSISTHTSSADGLYSAAFGFDAHATADYSLAVGNNIDTTGANSYSLGKDYTNNQDRTFKVGWDSTPTLKVNETEVTVDGDLGVSGLPFGFYDAMHIPNGMNGTYLCSLGGSVIPGLNYTCIGCKFTDGSGGATCNTHTAGADKMCMCRGSKSL